MKTSIVFGSRWLDVELPDEVRETGESGGTRLPPADDLDETVAAALQHPLGLPPLGELARGARRVTVAFDDPTVPCFAPLWETAIAQVIDALRAAGVADENIRLLCANALHRKFTGRELAALLGARLAAEHAGRIECHDAEDPDNLVHLGVTPSGYDVELNRAVVESDLTIYVNASCYRGFNGGWKSVCVGLSTWRSIRWHHTPERMSLTMDRNPLHEILDEMGALVEARLGRARIFKVETLLANPLQVARVWAGSVGDTRRAALEAVRAATPRRRDLLGDRADIVIYGVPEWSPYAAFSSMNPLLTLLSTGLGYLGGVINALGKPGCSVILATPCPDRWDEARHPSYREVWERVLPAIGGDPDEALRRFGPELAARSDYLDAYRHGNGFHPVHPLMGLFPLTRLRHAARVFIAGIESPALARHAGFEPTATVEEAVERARAIHGRDAAITLVRYPPAFNRQ
jgi:nickel-dependent lactate racemase